MALRGKVALVTGGAHRLGRAVVLELASRGVDVALNYHRSRDAAVETQRCASAFGVRAVTIQADAGDAESARAMAAAAYQQLGPVDFLIACAGVFRRTPVETVQDSDWRDMMRGNFETFRAAVTAVRPHLTERSAIIAFGDVAAIRPWADYIPYCVSKSRVLAHARLLARTLAPTVRVNAVLPGPVLFPPDYPDDKARNEIERTLLQRVGHAEDVARAVAFLLENDYLTGVELPVDGGRLLV